MKETTSKSLALRLDLLERENKVLRDELRSLGGKLASISEAASCNLYLQTVIDSQLKLNHKIDCFHQEILALDGHLLPADAKRLGTQPNSHRWNSKSVAALVADSIAGLSTQLTQLHTMLSELKASQQALRESLTTTKLHYDKEIWLLEEKWKALAKELGDQSHTLNLAQKIDWSRLAEDLQLEEQRAQAVASTLLEKIRLREANIYKLLEARSTKSLAATGDLKKIKVASMRAPPRDKDNLTKQPPDQPQPVESSNHAAASQLHADHEEFELELTDNSVSRSGGVPAGLQEAATNIDLKKKLLFDEEPKTLEGASVPNGKKSIPPNSLLRMRRKNPSNENSFVRDHKSQSQNNSLLEQSNASRRKKQLSNVIIRTKSASQQGDDSERRQAVLSPISEQKLVPKHFAVPEHLQLDNFKSSLEFTDGPRKDSMFDVMFAKKQLIGKPDSKENSNSLKTTPLSSIHTRTVSFEDRHPNPNASINTQRIQIGLDRSLSIKSSHRRRLPANP